MVNAVVKSRSPLWIAEWVGSRPATLGQKGNYNGEDSRNVPIYRKQRNVNIALRYCAYATGQRF